MRGVVVVVVCAKFFHRNFIITPVSQPNESRRRTSDREEKEKLANAPFSQSLVCRLLPLLSFVCHLSLVCSGKKKAVSSFPGSMTV